GHRELLVWHVVITENLERRGVVPIAWQTQVNTTETRREKRRGSIKPFARKIAFWTFRNATKYIAIKSDQLFPVPGDQICMNVFRLNCHRLSLVEVSTGQ